MHRSNRSAILVASASFVALATVGACGRSSGESASGAAAAVAPRAVTLTLGAYTTPREAYGKAILPAFKQHWRAQTKRDAEFRESYLGSGAQARAILGGFEADIAALSLEPDIEKLREAGLVRDDWKAGEHAGIVTRSVVVIGVRQGNPKGIRTWQDLAQPGIEVLTTNVRTSGGAMWNVLAIYGAALRGHAGIPAGDAAAATRLLAGVLGNVRIMDSGARESMLTFERGVGDAIITYENEILVAKAGGATHEYVIPTSTILIENPVAIVNKVAEQHGAGEAARAFVAFLTSPEAQRAFAQHGFRPVLGSVAEEVRERFPAPADLFTIADLGGWAGVRRDVFASGAAYDRATAASRAAGL